MLLKTVYIRFYKSFNFDYLKKYHNESKPLPWETIEDSYWYPYVRIPIDPRVTTVVGANESGKTHLLTAIEKGIRGKGIEREDFCRYSQFFAVEHGKMRWPDFGFEWTDLSDAEKNLVRETFKIDSKNDLEFFILFRENNDQLTAYVHRDGEYSRHASSKDAKAFNDKLPRVFRIDAEVGLPESVPIRTLAEMKEEATDSALETLGRKNRRDFFTSVFDNREWFDSAKTVTQNAANIHSEVSKFYVPADSGSAEITARKNKELALAHDLICKVAKIGPEALQELYKALREEKDAYANGLVQKINDALAVRLNFPNRWVQDKDFRLMVSPREYDLVFTIRDRTGTEYSFGERSSGLRYFLSYYIQYLAYEPERGEGEGEGEGEKEREKEILLMDEPDAYLSSQGQQDLMKILDEFSDPQVAKSPVQVIYVTHSPFLIDKNHSERIRVLEKGVGDEGTRVVRDTAKNHYEPLRSAFGAFVGETTFIGNCNIMVEGPADQILLAGAAKHLRSRGAAELETLDLNQVTIVPAGSASHIPYLVYLARGRDIEKPSVVVLLDSDQSGNEARKGLLRGGPKWKQLLKKEFILQVGDLASGKQSVHVLDGQVLTELEDLIPVSICTEAAKAYLRELGDVTDEDLEKITDDAIKLKLKTMAGSPVFDALQACLDACDHEGLHIEKVGFARAVLATVTKMASEGKRLPAPQQDVLAKFDNNLKILFSRIGEMQRQADRERMDKRVSGKVERIKDSFFQDCPDNARREQAFLLLEEIDAALDDSLESDEIRIKILKLRRDFKLEQDVTNPVDNYTTFQENLEGLKYAGRLATQEDNSEELAPKTAEEPGDVPSAPPKQAEDAPQDGTPKAETPSESDQELTTATTK